MEKTDQETAIGDHAPGAARSTMTCATCKFFHADQPNEGECRRYPPHAFLVGISNTPIGQQPAFTSAFPRIRKSLGCGEWKTKIQLQ